MIDTNNIAKDIALIKENAPLVLNITNYVAMNFSANALLSIGASPIMAHAEEEMLEMSGIAGSLVLNIGTLDKRWVKGMLKAGQSMHKQNKPIILDPVGVGASKYRMETCRKIIKKCSPNIIRGNGSEIMALVKADNQGKGVDSTVTSDSALESAKRLALKTNAIVVISGEIDYITDGKRVEKIFNGDALMTKVTAMGCTATALIGAFAAINKDFFQASVHAMSVMGVVGEMAAKRSAGNGSLQVSFLDELFLLSPETLLTNIKQL